ncbi:unnamed protein product [Caretta caretta]
MAGPEADPRATPVSLGSCMRQDRLVLGSVSPYLRDRMASTESRGGEVQLQDVSPSVLQSILRYLYTEELVLTAERAQELFVTASRLQIPPLLETVSRFLVETISLETCLRLYALAHAHQHPALLRAAGRYVSLHFRSLCEHDAFLRLDPGTLIGIIASDGLAVASELAIYRAVGRWVRADPAKRLPLLPELLGHVRLALLTPKELAEVQADVAELSGAAGLGLKELTGEGRLRESGGLRRGMYKEVIVCVGRRVRRDRAAGEDLDSPLDCFDPRTERWGAPLGSVPVQFPGFAALGHKLYVAGGCGPDGCFSTSLHEYDACSGQWAQLPSMSWPLDPHGFLVCSRRLYAVGGCAEAAGKLDSAETFDPGEREGASCLGNFQASRACFFLGEDGKVRQEVAIPALPRAIESAGAICWRGRVYVVGGEDSARWLNTVYYWEPSAAAWTPCREGPAAGEGTGWFGCVALQVPRRRLRALFQGQPTAPAAGGAVGQKQLTCRTSAMAPPPVSGKGGLMCPSTAPGSDQGSPLA